MRKPFYHKKKRKAEILLREPSHNNRTSKISDGCFEPPLIRPESKGCRRRVRISSSSSEGVINQCLVKVSQKTWHHGWTPVHKITLGVDRKKKVVCVCRPVATVIKMLFRNMTAVIFAFSPSSTFQELLRIEPFRKYSSMPRPPSLRGTLRKHLATLHWSKCWI